MKFAKQIMHLESFLIILPVARKKNTDWHFGLHDCERHQCSMRDRKWAKIDQAHGQSVSQVCLPTNTENRNITYFLTFCNANSVRDWENVFNPICDDIFLMQGKEALEQCCGKSTSAKVRCLALCLDLYKWQHWCFASQPRCSKRFTKAFHSLILTTVGDCRARQSSRQDS